MSVRRRIPEYDGVISLRSHVPGGFTYSNTPTVMMPFTVGMSNKDLANANMGDTAGFGTHTVQTTGADGKPVTQTVTNIAVGPGAFVSI